jgi:hypothetical protein
MSHASFRKIAKAFRLAIPGYFCFCTDQLPKWLYQPFAYVLFLSQPPGAKSKGCRSFTAQFCSCANLQMRFRSVVVQLETLLRYVYLFLHRILTPGFETTRLCAGVGTFRTVEGISQGCRACHFRLQSGPTNQPVRLDASGTKYRAHIYGCTAANTTISDFGPSCTKHSRENWIQHRLS